MKSSYPLGTCPNLGLKINTCIRHYDSFRRILKTNIRHYDSLRRIFFRSLIGLLKFPNNFMLFHY